VSEPAAAGPFDPAALPADALVVLVGPAGCGKSSFARRHFTGTQVVSSDACRRMVSDDEADQSATRQAFPVFHAILRGRLELGRLAVADATHLRAHTRRRLAEMAAERGRPAVAVVFDFPLALCLERAGGRARVVDPEVIRRHHEELQQAKVDVLREGFAKVWFVLPAEGGRPPPATAGLEA
jgi:predicted kinase